MRNKFPLAIRTAACYNLSMHSTECVIVGIAAPNRAKREWLERMQYAFADAVQLGLDAAQDQQTSSRAKLHKAVYYPARTLGLPGDYARMAVNASVSLSRSFYGLRKAGRRATFPNVNGSQGIGLGVYSYKCVRDGNRWALRVSTGKRGEYLWLPMQVPAKYTDRIALAYGDAKLFQRAGKWYVALPIRVTSSPTGCSGERTFIGVDLGVVRHATVATPDRVAFFSGKEARRKREHCAAVRKRYQRHRRTDRVKQQRGKERRWMQDVNHVISRRIVDLAAQYPNPVIVLEQLDGIRDRTHGSKKFNRMMSSWAFRELADFICYKAERLGIPVVFCDPRGTSKTCPKCGHSTRSNRPTQSSFRCVSCGYQGNADMVAARNIAARGPEALAQGAPDMPRPLVGQPDIPVDGAKECELLSHLDSNLVSSVSEPHAL
jgi:IS605 OrfB family transposase